MNPKIIFAVVAPLLLLTACGYKGDLYLPKEGDNATFGPVQTGIGLTPPTTSDAAVSDLGK